jgi:hypothetical protein
LDVIKRIENHEFWSKGSEDNNCFFCGYHFLWPPFPMPVGMQGGQYIVEGVVFCTPNCVKSELNDRSHYYGGQRAELLTDMLSDLYNFTDKIETVEKKVFKRYHGIVTHEEYISDIAKVCKLQLVTNPFICQPSCFQNGFHDTNTPSNQLLKKAGPK